MRIQFRLVAKTTETEKKTAHLDEFRSALAVRIPAKLGCSLQQTAELRGVRTAPVNHRQSRLESGRVSGAQARNWGGRRRSLLTLEGEIDFPKPWAEKAQDAGLLVLSPIRAALLEPAGHPVKTPGIGRLLERHGWRKVAPDTRHPRTHPAGMADWKNNS